MANDAERAVSTVVKSRALEGHRVIAAWLFGSHARGEAHRGSDVDVAVLCEPPLGHLRANVSDEASRSANLEIDVIDMATAPPVLVWEIVTTGKLVVERDEESVERFVRRARFLAEDATRRDRIVVLAQAGHVGKATE